MANTPASLCLLSLDPAFSAVPTNDRDRVKKAILESTMVLFTDMLRNRFDLHVHLLAGLVPNELCGFVTLAFQHKLLMVGGHQWYFEAVFFGNTPSGFISRSDFIEMQQRFAPHPSEIQFSMLESFLFPERNRLILTSGRLDCNAQNVPAVTRFATSFADRIYEKCTLLFKQVLYTIPSQLSERQSGFPLTSWTPLVTCGCEFNAATHLLNSQITAGVPILDRPALESMRRVIQCFVDLKDASFPAHRAVVPMSSHVPLLQHLFTLQVKPYHARGVVMSACLPGMPNCTVDLVLRIAENQPCVVLRRNMQQPHHVEHVVFRRPSDSRVTRNEDIATSELLFQEWDSSIMHADILPNTKALIFGTSVFLEGKRDPIHHVHVEYRHRTPLLKDHAQCLRLMSTRNQLLRMVEYAVYLAMDRAIENFVMNLTTDFSMARMVTIRKLMDLPPQSNRNPKRTWEHFLNHGTWEDEHWNPAAKTMRFREATFGDPEIDWIFDTPQPKHVAQEEMPHELLELLQAVPEDDCRLTPQTLFTPLWDQ